MDMVLACFILAEKFSAAERSQLEAKICLQDAECSWNYQFFQNKPKINNEIIKLYQAKCADKAKYKAILMSKEQPT